jgi:hypothetical protein
MGARHPFAIMLLVLFTSYSYGFGQVNDPPPQVIIKRMAEQYATVLSYQDSGVVETVVGGSLPMRSTDISFTTYFTRPRKLRFEWLGLSSPSSPERNVIWSDGAKTFGYYNFEPGKIEEKEDIAMGIAGATGVSRMSAHTVPSLLIQDSESFLLTDLTKLTLTGRERFEDEECYVLAGYHPNGERWRLWIGKKDFLLRKLMTQGTNGEFAEEIHRDIQTNSVINEETYHPKLMADGHLATRISKEKGAAIRHLLELISPRDRVNQQLNDLSSNLKQAMPQVPEKVWQDVLTELNLNADFVLQYYMPIYDNYYSNKEIKQLIVFYESPLGKKMLRNMPLIELEATLHGNAIGQELIKRISEKLKTKGYGVPAT